jgi:hypothetical protein
MHKIISTLLATVLLTATGVSAGPFGFDLNKQPPSIYCKAKETATYFKCTSAPKPHSMMESYIIQYTDAAGICWLKAVGFTQDVNIYGDELTSRLALIGKQISKKYGPPNENIDELRDGSIWDEPRDYMMSMLKDERWTWQKWNLDKAANQGLHTIYVNPDALSRDRAYVTVEFYYSDSCESTAQEADADSF